MSIVTNKKNVVELTGEELSMISGGGWGAAVVSGIVGGALSGCFFSYKHMVEYKFAWGFVVKKESTKISVGVMTGAIIGAIGGICGYWGG